MQKPWLKFYDAEVHPELRYPLIPAHTILESTARLCPGLIALQVYGNRSFTYWELFTRVKQAASALIEMGLKKGDRVAVALPNGSAFVQLFWGTLMAGGVFVGLNPLYTKREMSQRIKETEPEILVAWDRLFDDALAGIDVPKCVPVNLDAEHLLFSEYSVSKPGVEVNPKDLAFIQYTSGTEGTPKGCMFTHESYVAAVYSSYQWTSALHNYYPPDERGLLMVLPMSHIFGLVNIGFGAKTRTPLFILRQFDPDAAADFLSMRKISSFPCVPAMLELLLKHPKILEGGFKVRNVTIGGGVCPPRLLQQMESVEPSPAIHVGWGMTETCSRGLATPVVGMKKEGSVGIPMCGIDAKVADPSTGEELPPDVPGELWVKSPTVMMGYWKDEESTKKVLIDGWLRTGDLARMDVDGFFYIEGREKDLIKHGGNLISPQEIDNVLVLHPEVLDAVTFGVPDETYEENLVAVVRAAGPVTEEELLAFCTKNLAPFKIPSRIVVTKEPLPRTATGKPLRWKAREIYGGMLR